MPSGNTLLSPGVSPFKYCSTRVCTAVPRLAARFISHLAASSPTFLRHASKPGFFCTPSTVVIEGKWLPSTS